MRRIHLLAALPLTCLFAQAALAQGACTKQLTPKNMVQMTSTAGGPSTIPVTLNGTDQKLTLATAGTTTQITADTAKALKLDPRHGDMTLPDPFTGGVRKVDEVTIADFSLGTLHGKNVTWAVSGGRGGRGGGGGGESDSEDNARPAGLFSLNYMRLYDIDVDFGNDKLIFFSQDHCPGGVLYWKAPGEVGAVPLTVDNGRVMVPVTLNGKTVNAVIDTAAPTSSLRTAVAQRFLGVDLGGPKAPTGKSDFFGNPTYTWTADGLTIGKLKLDSVAFNVQADLNAGQGKDPALAQRAKASAIQFELDHPEIVLGMDALRKLHLYFAFGENKLYVTGTTSTLPATAAKTP